MALATRCPHCETVFKLDPHLLAPHDGRVRCGHCQEVFDAAHHRFELPDDDSASDEAQHAAILDDDIAIGPSPTPVSKTDGAPNKPKVAAPRTLDVGASLGNRRPVPPRPAALLPVSPSPDDDNDRTVHAGKPASNAAANEPAPPPADPDRVKQFVRVKAQPSDDQPGSQARAKPPLRPVDPPTEESSPFVDPVDDRAEPFIGPGRRTPEPPPPPRPAPTPAPAWRDDDEPGFGTEAAGIGHPASANEAFPVSHEAYAAPVHWTKHKGWRVVGAVLAVLLTLLLIVQAAWWLREDVMVMVPGTHTLYAQACDEIGCAIAPPRDIDGLQIEMSGLRQIDGPHKLELKLSLRNRLDVALAYPALELTLLDNNNVAVRRVLWPQEYARPGTIFAIGLPPQSAQPIVVRLDTGDAVAANYRVQVFYP
ncbi:putative transmembrane protein [Candidatus Burkholderia verschuerenii]|uniref:Putative transmembrane protein n=1 Tax=Candidatus Burkholderia verschuerenii TaxID=242163 RepID=A0A0L0MD16_9BURK|nr:zinc-ribbon and DUF3426 domain-containing protein [Candidatus Burkholderia verschuerenii]KND60155.1 putative transmembrane protein [Candidatus Burkholderia verschuerenii]